MSRSSAVPLVGRRLSRERDSLLNDAHDHDHDTIDDHHDHDHVTHVPPSPPRSPTRPHRHGPAPWYEQPWAQQALTVAGWAFIVIVGSFWVVQSIAPLIRPFLPSQPSSPPPPPPPPPSFAAAAAAVAAASRSQTHRVGPLPWAAGETPLDDSFAGFVHVRDTPHQSSDASARTNASIFYWFFPAQQPLEEHPPLIVWLQGGPGSSSMIGLFYEMGPIRLDDNDLLLRRNPDSWNTHYSMLFIDNPVGTGFSFVDTPSVRALREPASMVPLTSAEDDAIAAAYRKTEQCESKIASSGASGASADPSTSSTTKHRGRRDDRRQPEPEIPEFSNGYAANQAAVAHDLIVFLDKFYEMYPDQLQSRLYITGESYAGKYVPHLAFHIDRVNANRAPAPAPDAANEASKSAGSSTRPKIPLAGIAIGNGLTDPITQVSYHAPQALALGLVSRSQAATMQRFADLSVGYICLEEWQKALSLRLRIFDTFRDATGGINWYDVRKGDVPNDWSRMEEFLGLPATKTSLNVGPSAWFGKDPEVYNALQGDVMKSAALVVAYLLDKQYRVVLYQGQFDFRDGIMASSEWIEGLDWHGAEGYATAEREIWRLATPGTDAPYAAAAESKTSAREGSPHIVGFSREYANLARVELLHAGHLAPMDQGFVSKRMIDDYLIHATKPVAAPPSTPADPSEP